MKGISEMNKLTSVKNMRRGEYFKVYFNEGKRFWVGGRLNGPGAKYLIRTRKSDKIIVTCVRSHKTYLIPKETQVERILKGGN